MRSLPLWPRRMSALRILCVVSCHASPPAVRIIRARRRDAVRLRDWPLTKRTSTSLPGFANSLPPLFTNARATRIARFGAPRSSPGASTSARSTSLATLRIRPVRNQTMLTCPLPSSQDRIDAICAPAESGCERVLASNSVLPEPLPQEVRMHPEMSGRLPRFVSQLPPRGQPNSPNRSGWLSTTRGFPPISRS